MPPTKYRPRHKRLSDLRQKDTTHGFSHRIHVQRSQIQGSDPVYCSVLDLSRALDPERSNTSHQDSARGSNSHSGRADAEVHVPAFPSSEGVGAAASSSSSGFMDHNDHMPVHYSNPRRKAHLRPRPRRTVFGMSVQNAVSSTPLHRNDAQVHPRTSYSSNGGLQGTSTEFRRGVSPSRPITSGQLPYPGSGKSSRYHPIARPQTYKFPTRQIPDARKSSEIPATNYAGTNDLSLPPTDGHMYPGTSNGFQGTPSFYPTASSGLLLSNFHHLSNPQDYYNGRIPSMRGPEILQAPRSSGNVSHDYDGYTHPAGGYGSNGASTQEIPHNHFQGPSSNHTPAGLPDPLRPWGSAQVYNPMTNWLGSYNMFPHTSQFGEQGPSTEFYPTHESTPSQVPYASAWSDGIDTRGSHGLGYNTNWNTTYTTPAWPAGAEIRPTVRPDFVHGSAPDFAFNHPRNNFEMDSGNDYNSYGHNHYPPTHPGTARVPASSGRFPLVSMGNSDGFRINNESTYPQDGYFYGSTPGNNGF